MDFIFTFRGEHCIKFLYYILQLNQYYWELGLFHWDARPNGFEASELEQRVAKKWYKEVQCRVDQTLTEMQTCAQRISHRHALIISAAYICLDVCGCLGDWVIAGPPWWGPKMLSGDKTNAGRNTLLASMHTWMHSRTSNPVTTMINPCAAHIL